jgi:hypothetical protein
MLEPGLEAFDVFLDLLEEGQLLSQPGQARVWSVSDLIECRRAGGDHHRVQRIVLGAAQMHPAECLDLNRLQHLYGEACSPQMLHHAALVAARRLDADAANAGLCQPICQNPPARQRIGDLPLLGSAVKCNIELAFGRIDSRRRHASLRHLRRPCLVKRT